MGLDSYSALKTSIADTLNRSDLTSAIGDFITLAEARMRRVLRSNSVFGQVLTLTAGTNTVALPATVGAVVEVTVEGSANLTAGPIAVVSRAVFDDHLRRHPTSGPPQVVTLSATTISLSPIPDQAYTLIVRSERYIDALTVSAPSNWVLESHPDLYLYGALAESAPYLRDDERIPVWEGRFQKGIEEAEIQLDRARYPAQISVPVPRTFSATPQGY